MTVVTTTSNITDIQITNFINFSKTAADMLTILTTFISTILILTISCLLLNLSALLLCLLFLHCKKCCWYITVIAIKFIAPAYCHSEFFLLLYYLLLLSVCYLFFLF